MSFAAQIGAGDVRATTKRLRMAERLLLWAGLRAQRRSAFHQGDGISRTIDVARYDAWRAQSLRQQLVAHFDVRRLRGRDVLDFGCGTGGLTVQLATEFGCRRVVGVDMSAAAVERTRSRVSALPEERRHVVSVVHAQSDRRIELPDASVDFICCFDVVEHIPHIVDTVAEWRRVLRAGGEVWIWWSPWRGPYGHHVESLLPLPWIHLLFAPQTIFAVCAAVYDHPSFVPRIWDIDPETGRKRTNKWRTLDTREPFLNQLTRRQFERAVSQGGLAVAERKTHGFSGSRLSRATRPFTGIPALGECFVSFFTYRLLRVM